MNKNLLDQLKPITLEEQKLLEEHGEIDTAIYMSEASNVVDCNKLLEHGKLIQVRPHTRFVHFPVHTHNYVEVIYMCSGRTHHVINGDDVYLETGELLFLNQHAKQEIYPAGQDDIAINFIILPEFFDYALTMMEEEENLLRDFIVSCLRSQTEEANYLHFKVADILPIQNLVENLIWTILNKQPNKRKINEATMGLLFLQLMNHTDKVEISKRGFKQDLTLTVLRYIEENYKDGELSKLAKNLHYDVYWLSRMIKQSTGKTYIELLQLKRLNQAAYLLCHTKLTVADIGLAIGYDNLSYFHRIFKQKYEVSPKVYRKTYQEKVNK